MPITILMGTDNSFRISQYNKACQKVVLHNLNCNYQWWYSCGKWIDTWSSVCGVVSFRCAGSKALVTWLHMSQMSYGPSW